MLSRVEAILSLPAGASLKSEYHELRLMAWDESRQRDVSVKEFFVSRDDSVPFTIVHAGILYRQGQCSGPAMTVVWFEI